MRRVILILTLMLPLAAAAQESLTLQECLRLGLERNYDIRLMRNEERIANNNATRGNAGFWPTVDLSAGYSGTLNDTKQFPHEGDATSTNGVHNQSANAGINLGWTVFDGFSVQTSYKRLQELQRMGELNTRLQVETFISQFAAEYYNYIRQQISLRNFEYAVQLSRERLEIVQLSLDLGVQSGYDLQQARVDLNADSSRLIKQHEVLHTLSTQLNEMIAAVDVDEQLMLADFQIDYDANLQRDQLWQSAVENNIYLKIARKQGDISRIDLKAVKSRNYPYIKINGGYGYNGNWYGGGTYDRQRTLGLNYGVTMGFTIFDGLNQRRQKRNARIEVENSELEYNQMELGINVDLANAWMAYENNLKLVELEKANLQTARTGYELARERYLSSQLSGIELREAQTSLLDAEERMIQVVYDTKMCEISLMQIAGLITEYLE